MKAVLDMGILELLGQIIDLVDEVTPKFLRSYIIILETAFNCQSTETGIEVKAQTLLRICCDGFVNEDLINQIGSDYGVDIDFFECTCRMFKAYMDSHFEGKQSIQQIIQWFPL